MENGIFQLCGDRSKVEIQETVKVLLPYKDGTKTKVEKADFQGHISNEGRLLTEYQLGNSGESWV